VRAEYSCCPPEERGTVVSNEVVVTVTEPGGSDGKLFRDVLQRRPELLTKWAYAVGLVEPSDLEEIERLLREHEGSPYLGRMRQLYWERRLEDAYRVRGIDALLTEEEKALLRQAEEEPAASDPFHENRLLCAARTGIAWGDYEGAARTYGKLLSAYPDSEAVDEARSWIDRARLEVR
jgi:hypothetical protein